MTSTPSAPCVYEMKQKENTNTRGCAVYSGRSALEFSEFSEHANWFDLLPEAMAFCHTKADKHIFLFYSHFWILSVYNYIKHLSLYAADSALCKFNSLKTHRKK